MQPDSRNETKGLNPTDSKSILKLIAEEHLIEIPLNEKWKFPLEFGTFEVRKTARPCGAFCISY